MKVLFIEHARNRMNQYNVSIELVHDVLNNSDSVVSGYFGREIYQKRLNDYVIKSYY
jgi:hypothetical protein